MLFANLEYTKPEPSTMPVSVDEFKEHARLKGITVGVDDALLTRELKAATLRAENWMRRTTIVRGVRALYLPDTRLGTCNYTAQSIVLPRGRVESVTSVTVGDVDVPPDTGYKLSEWGVITLTAWPSMPATVVWVSGFGPAATDVPDQIREGILEYATQLYEDRRGNREIKATSDTGPGVPTGVQDLLRSFQIEISG